MFRREFLRLFSGAVAAGPLVARAQLSTMPVVGYLDASSAVGREAVVAAFRDGLKQMRFVEGYTLKIEYRWADNNVDRLADLIADLVRHEVSALLVAGNIAAQRAHAATKAVPVVFVVGNDPIKLRLVESLSHPGGNITGITPLNADLGPKRLQIVRELAPTADVIGLLINPANPVAGTLPEELAEPARNLRLNLHIVRASNDRELDDAFDTLNRIKAAAVLIGADTFFNGRSAQVAALALRHKLPSVYGTREFTAAGGLLSYGASIPDAFHTAGLYVGRILKGEKPGELPVQQATRIELTINLKTAKALGIAVPAALLARADAVIE